MAVTFPSFSNGAGTGLAQLSKLGSNYQKPFTSAGLWLTSTQQSAGGLIGGNFTTGSGLHTLVPVIIGRRRYVTVFAGAT